jgi:hypothetical protein
MSTIFTTIGTTTTPEPRQDATIRVEVYNMPPGVGTDEPAVYRPVKLLSFFPDHDARALKMRGYALIGYEDWMQHPAYEVQGAGYLERPYVSVREFMIHPQDRREMLAYCNKYHQGMPLVIHPQPRPFPLFKKGSRVIVIEYKDEHYDTRAAGQVGQLATTTEASSPGAMTRIRFDQEELNQGFQSVSLPSIALREIEPSTPGPVDCPTNGSSQPG